MKPATSPQLRSAIRRDKYVVLATIAAILIASWTFVIVGAGMHMSVFEMTRMETTEMGRVLSGEPATSGAMSMPANVWTYRTAIAVFFMWWIMMAAMMLPTALTAVLAFTEHARANGNRDEPYQSVAAYVSGYLLIWGLFSLASVGVQWGLQRSGLLTPMIVITNLPLDALLLLFAGAYQFTPVQRASLQSCRSCHQTIIDHWRAGNSGAVAMGLSEGMNCLQSCWPLMLLLFLAGAMNIYWIVGLAAAVLLQKMAPGGDRLGYVIGAVLVLWGAWEMLAVVL